MNAESKIYDESEGKRVRAKLNDSSPRAVILLGLASGRRVECRGPLSNALGAKFVIGSSSTWPFEESMNTPGVSVALSMY